MKQTRPIPEIIEDLILEMRKKLKVETEVHFLVAELLRAMIHEETEGRRMRH